MAEIEIQVNDDGPYVITGVEVKLIDGDGNEIDARNQKVVQLCRCGGSTTMPFCDGKSSKTGFEGAREAVEKEQQKEASG